MDDHLKILTILLALSALSSAAASIPRRELESATAALRAKGHSLFGNSLTLSDLLFQILAGDSFTLLCPPDTSLFSLGMSIDSFRYVHSLRLHVLPRRLSLADLRNLSLSETPSVDSLVPYHPLFVTNRRIESSAADSAGPGGGAAALDYIVVNGVRISSPDIFLGLHIAVHGLDGSLAADMLPPDVFHGDLGLGFVPPPILSKSEDFAPQPAFGPDLDAFPPPISPAIEAFSPDYGGSPIFPYWNLPPSKPWIPSPERETSASSPRSSNPAPETFGKSPRSANPAPETFAKSPRSANLAPETFGSAGPSPAVSMPPEIPGSPSPWHDRSDPRGSGKIESKLGANLSPQSGIERRNVAPLQSPFNSPRIWGTAPMTESVWTKDPRQPWRRNRAMHETNRHRRWKRKHKCGGHQTHHRRRKDNL